MSTVNVTDESPVLHVGVCTLGYSYRYVLEDWDWKGPTASSLQYISVKHTHIRLTHSEVLITAGLEQHKDSFYELQCNNV